MNRPKKILNGSYINSVVWPVAEENVVATRLETRSYSEKASSIAHILTQVKDKDLETKKIVVITDVLEHRSNKCLKNTNVDPVRMTNTV